MERKMVKCKARNGASVWVIGTFISLILLPFIPYTILLPSMGILLLSISLLLCPSFILSKLLFPERAWRYNFIVSGTDNMVVRREYRDKSIQILLPGNKYRNVYICAYKNNKGRFVSECYAVMRGVRETWVTGPTNDFGLIDWDYNSEKPVIDISALSLFTDIIYTGESLVVTVCGLNIGRAFYGWTNNAMDFGENVMSEIQLYKSMLDIE